MKKIISNYAGKLLSREDLKAIKGGYDEITAKNIEELAGITLTAEEKALQEMVASHDIIEEENLRVLTIGYR